MQLTLPQSDDSNMNPASSTRQQHHSEAFHNLKRTVFRKAEHLVQHQDCDCFVMVHNRADNKIFTYTSDELNFNIDRVC